MARHAAYRRTLTAIPLQRFSIQVGRIDAESFDFVPFEHASHAVRASPEQIFDIECVARDRASL
jgi:hypothetical protein